jgi:hypothetical protein
MTTHFFPIIKTAKNSNLELFILRIMSTYKLRKSKNNLDVYKKAHEFVPVV